MAFGADKLRSQHCVVTNVRSRINERHARAEKRLYRSRCLVLVLARALYMACHVDILVSIPQFKTTIANHSGVPHSYEA